MVAFGPATGVSAYNYRAYDGSGRPMAYDQATERQT
jgi:hypothetical protein